MKKRSIRKTAAAVRRQENRKTKERGLWAKREQRLLNLIDVMKTNKTMQPEDWVKGQVAYYEKLLANHRTAKPK